MERAFLELLQFNINVPSSVYAKYYFDLRSLADANDLVFPLEPLSKERARKLEVRFCPHQSVASRERRVSKPLLNPEEFESASSSFLCRWKTFLKWRFSTIMTSR